MPETVPMFTPSEIPEVHATLRRSRHRPSRPLWQFTVADDTTEAGRAELAPLAEWLKTAELADPWWANCTSIDNPLLEVACSPGHRNVRLTFDRTDSSGTAFADPFSADEFETFLERLVAAGNDETDVFCLTLAAAVRKNPNDKRFLDRYVDWACVQEGAVHLTACYHNPAFTVDQLLQLIELELSAGFTYVVRRLAELAPEKFAEFTVGDAVVVANITAALKDNWLNTPEPSEGSVKVPHPLAPVWENISNELAVAVMRTNPTVLARGLSQGIVPAGPVKQVNRKRFADALSEVSFEDGGAVTAVGWLAQLPARDVIPILEGIAADFDRHDDFDMPEELLAFLAGHLDRVGDRREELLAAMAKSGKPLGVLAEKYMAPST